MVAQLGTIVTAYADTIMVGHYTTQALAAASFVTNAFNLLILLSLGFSYGITPLAGALTAQSDERKLGNMLRGVTVANVAFGSLLMIMMIIFYFCLDYLGQPQELLPQIRSYYLIILVSMIPVILTHIWRQFCDAMGHTSLGMWIFITGNLLNILFNYVFIYGKFGAPELGLDGAGWATLGARTFMCAVYMAVIMGSRRYHSIWKNFKKSRVNKAMLKQITATSLPVSLQMGMETGIFTYAMILAGWLGTNALAAYQVILMLGSLGFMIYYAFGAGTAIKIAHYTGQGDTENVRSAAGAGYIITLTFTAIACITFLTLGHHIIKIFSTDHAVLAIAVSIIPMLTLYQLGDATQIAFANSLRGTGQTIPIMKYAFVAYVVAGIPVIYLPAIPLGMGLNGIFLGFFISLLLAGIFFCRQFYHTLSQKA